jgi:TonB family protein
MNGKLRLLRSILPLVLLPVLLAAAAPDPAAVVKTAWKQLGDRHYRDAVESFRRAEELTGNTCGACQIGLSRAYTGLGKAPEAVEAARKAVTLVKTPEALTQAYNQLGVALLSVPGADPAEAEAAFRKTLEVAGDAETTKLARYNLAEVLLREKRYADSIEAARQYLEVDPEGFASNRARATLCMARRADKSPFLTPEEMAEHQVDCQTKKEILVVGGKDPAVTAKVSRPEKLFGAVPVYTESARRDKVNGKVILESIIDEDGCVRHLVVCRGLHPDLDRSAMDTISTWVFKPATLEGKPVKIYYVLTVSFSVQGGH